ncbi:helix-turn-helix transcriptional regulator [Alsobacter sp. R-9]
MNAPSMPPVATRRPPVPGFPGAPPVLLRTFDLMRQVSPWPLVMVDETARVVVACMASHAMLGASRGISLRDGSLWLDRSRALRQTREAVAAAVAAAHAAGAGDYPSWLVGVPDGNGRTGIVLKIMPVAAEGAEPCALVALVDLQETASVRRASVMTLFGLSEREADLAENFSQGLKIDEIAGRMGVATNTVRVHLRNVFQKTGCSSQVELARLFLLLP